MVPIFEVSKLPHDSIDLTADMERAVAFDTTQKATAT